MRVKIQWIHRQELRSSVYLILWLNMCLLLYLLLPDSPVIDTQDVTTVDLDFTYREDPQQLIDLHNFEYLIKQSPCESHVQTLIMIHSAPGNVEKRQVIRETWGGDTIIYEKSPLRLVFVFGGVDNVTMQSTLEQEQSLYGDLLQGNFLDTYFNLTYKHVMALKWFDNHCGDAQILFKADDDIYINTPQLLPDSFSDSDEALSNLLRPRQDLLLCAKQDKPRVLRSYSSKWRISFREYSKRYYPPFCPGFAVVYSADVVRRLYSKAQRASYFRLDDVMVTGILAKRSNISITDLTPYVLYPKKMDALLHSASEPKALQYLVSWHKMSAKQIQGLWTLYGKANTLRPGN